MLVSMSTQKETVACILEKLKQDARFRVRAMFGEYALYADDKVVGLIGNDQLYIKIAPASAELEDKCEKDSPYIGAKEHYVLEESQYDTIRHLPEILTNIAQSLPTPKKRKK